VQLVIFLHTFTAPCMCPKIDVMERECKKLEFGGDLNRVQIISNATTLPHSRCTRQIHDATGENRDLVAGNFLACQLPYLTLYELETLSSLYYTDTCSSMACTTVLHVMMWGLFSSLCIFAKFHCSKEILLF
jgi:hypothetical protein